MTSPRAEKILYFLLVIVLCAAMVGAIFLLSYAESAHLAVFELTAFGVSIVAVALAVLGSIASIHQTREVRRIARHIEEAIAGLKEIDRDNESIKRKLGQDYALSQSIAEALAEAGVIDDDVKRRAVASDIETKLRSNIKHK